MGRNGAASGFNRSNRRRLFRACYGPVTSLLSANYLPVMVLFRALRRFSVNHRKTNGFLRILKAGIASEQGEKGA
jgi:hypothetical protein